MYRCIDCGEVFDEPESVRYNKDDYNGTADLFGNWQWGTYDACPNCGSEDIEETFEEEEEE